MGISRHHDGPPRVVCTRCGAERWAEGEEHVERLLTRIVSMGWTLLDDTGQMLELCPLCSGNRRLNNRGHARK